MRLWKPCSVVLDRLFNFAGFSETCSPLGILKIPNQLYCHARLMLVIALEIKTPASHSLTGFGVVGRTKINRSYWRSHKSVRIYICTFCSQYINFYARTAYCIAQVHSNPCFWWDRNIIEGTAWGYNQALVLVIRLWSWWAPWSLCFSSNNILCPSQYTIHVCLSGIRTQEVHFLYLAMGFLNKCGCTAKSDINKLQTTGYLCLLTVLSNTDQFWNIWESSIFALVHIRLKTLKSVCCAHVKHPKHSMRCT